MTRPPPRSTLFPYTTLFRSHSGSAVSSSVQSCINRVGRCRFNRRPVRKNSAQARSEEHTSELQSQSNLVCRLLLEKKKQSKTLSPSSPSHLHDSHPSLRPIH